MPIKQRKIEINYRPLQTSCDIEVVGSVPSKQVYQADFKEYTPDYTLTPLTLFPRCNATDPDAVNKIGLVNSKLTNMRWYERYGSTQTLIDSTNTDYSIVESGTNKGQITVKKNVETINPLTLEFVAEYVDARTGQVYVFQMTKLITSLDGTAAIPVLLLDAADTELWNPVRQKTVQRSFSWKALAGDTDVSDKCNFFLYRLLDTGALEQITDGSGDNDWEFVSLAGNTYTFDLNYIGEEMTFIVKATYDGDGNPSTDPNDAFLVKSAKFVRYIPKLWCDWQGVPNEVDNGTTVIYPKPIVTDSIGNIDLPEEMFRFFWYKSTNNGTSWTKVADIKAPAIPMTDGMILKLEVEDRGPYCYVVDSDGNVVCSGGVPVVVRKNG